MLSSMFPVAQYETHENTIPRITTIGNFRKNGPCYAGVVSTKRAYVFDSVLPPDQAKSYINAGQKITCMDTVKIKDHEHVVIGTDNSLIVFDVDQNAQLFTSLVSDGVYSISISQNTIYVGSNCAILGYDFTGEEVYWTVTGDIVTAMCEIELNGVKSLLVASKDHMIRQFVGEESKREMRIPSPCIFLRYIDSDRFVAAFENGSVSMYSNMSKVWNFASQGEIIGVELIDFSGRKQVDIIVGCADGSIFILDTANGQEKRKEDAKMALAGLGHLDIKNEGRISLAVIGTNGGVRIFMPKGVEGLGAAAKQAYELRENQPKMAKEKAKLLMRAYELQYEINTPQHPANASGVLLPPRGLKLEYMLGKNMEEQCIELQIKTNPPTPIQATVVECPTTSSNPFTVFDVNNPAKPVHKILLWLPNDVIGEMNVEAFISGVSKPFKISFQKFYGYVKTANANPEGYCEFRHPGDSFAAFAMKNFVTDSELGSNFKVSFYAVADKEPLVLSARDGVCQIGCQSVSTAARIVSEFCEFASLKEFECKAHFPTDLDLLMKAVREGGDLDDTKTIHRAEVAGLIAQVKDLIVRIENAEIIEHYKTVHDATVECERVNTEIAVEHAKRMMNREKLGTGSQKVNAFIQSFAELRRGNARNSLLQLCRRELQGKDFSRLPYILELGHDIKTQ